MVVVRTITILRNHSVVGELRITKTLVDVEKMGQCSTSQEFAEFSISCPQER